MDTEDFQIALELERLRGAVTTGFAELGGRLEGVLNRTDRTEKDIESLETRVSGLERKVWMAAGVAAVVSGGSVAGLLQALNG